jgi:hypothetical protein
MVTTVINTDITMPMMGAKNINSTVIKIVWLSTILDHGKAIPFSNKACAIAAPANPPISVWEEEEGIPYHHVSRFQKIAASSPEKNNG